ncbi:MAG: hypothetical protein DCC55_03290, partial [Chloroflexi bacterium]
MRFLPGAAPGLAESLQISRTVGIHVSAVVPGGPAAEAGLEPGDLITAIDGKVVTPATDLAALVAGYQPGDELTLTVQRPAEADGEQIVTVTLGAKPNDPETAYLGVQVAPVARIQAERVAPSGMNTPGETWRFYRRIPDARRYFFRAVPAPSLPTMPPMWMMPYGYWYGAPGYGVPYIVPPPGFIYLHPTPNAVPGA